MRHPIPSAIASLQGLQQPHGWPFTGMWQNQVLRMIGIQPIRSEARCASALLTWSDGRSRAPKTSSASVLGPPGSTR